MSDEGRRHLGAIIALVLGSFVGLTLLPVDLTGPFGRWLGGTLWELLGIGAIGFPLLGLAVGLAGFDRLPQLDMKRAAILVSGLAIVIPFIIGVIADVRPEGFDSTDLAPRLTGVIPGFAAYYVVSAIGPAGGLLFGFVSLSALTILTVAWHPLMRWVGIREVTEGSGGTAGGITGRGVGAGVIPPTSTTPDDDEEGVVAPRPAVRKEKKPKKPARTTDAPIGDPTDDSVLPPIDLLNPPLAQEGDAGGAELDRLGQVLLETLRTFKVEGSIAGRTTGPVVTQFEVVPAPGVKVGRIAALADDMAITMRAQSIRVAPIPGKGAVGVEIPNPTARMVSLRELLESDEWEHTRGTLPIALGRDLEGKPIIADLGKMPHLLIAGATGSGKSVAINTIISSLIYRYTDKQLRLLMVDPKMVELSMYNALPHLRHKVVTNNSDAASALKWAVYEMNRRYELLHANGARNLADFNKKVEEGKPLSNPPKARPTLSSIAAEGGTTPPEPVDDGVYKDGPLPFIVMIVDELADLMMTVQGEVETPLAILAQKARAIGIHLILATQRPSVNVITGLIKANFPSRIAFRVASKVDSRTILDQNGAEALLGNGDMLFLPPGKSEPMRLQGAFIATEETERLMDWFEARQAARVAAAAAARKEEDILALVRAMEQEEEGGGGPGEQGERDELFRRAAELCLQNQGGSTSLLQRRLSIGYGRAARIIDQLYLAGILGPNPPGSSKPREVLIGIEQLDEYCGD
ncbi:MAG: DNA translocase FtsK [Gemmatimonadota bacterium]|nr:DNA translocase FtsK [Gemmatimonadota bacterium]MDH5283788.1 DNA translocase FtsK [Gemmatimonadota bacterium]